MRETIRVWAISTLMIFAMVWQMNTIADADASKYLKEDLEIAVHDAAMCIDYRKLAEGIIIFDKKRAKQAFLDSLAANSHMKPVHASSLDMHPKPGSFFQDAFKVVTFDIIDDSHPDVDGFPYSYHHPLYDMDIVYDGPTIVAVVETYGPRYFSGEKSVIRRAASYSYQFGSGE
ncbi:MAG TPA: hypothetical protein VFK44_06630 [Bacillales bacterium]|nr:hypothetical protein [Bacillales bacterium]